MQAKGEIAMQAKVGVWIDHRNAYIAFIDEPIQMVESNLEKHVRYQGHSLHEQGVAEDQRDRQFLTHLHSYYDKVIERIASSKSIFIFGPGEAKGEFRSRLKDKHLDKHIVGFEAADKMTEEEITKKTRKHFHA